MIHIARRGARSVPPRMLDACDRVQRVSKGTLASERPLDLTPARNDCLHGCPRPCCEKTCRSMQKKENIALLRNDRVVYFTKLSAIASKSFAGLSRRKADSVGY
ncbi:hypothetical protein MRX96_010634 [Rhipicephalus microplus]